jgi:hypothetical protein
VIWVVWQPYRELVEDAPPEGGCRVVVGQRSFGGCRLNQTACVEACAIQVLQPLRQAWQERVIDQVRYQLDEQFRPLLILRRVVDAESPIESVLPGPRQKLRRSGPVGRKSACATCIAARQTSRSVIKPAGSTRSCSSAQVAASPVAQT